MDGLRRRPTKPCFLFMIHSFFYTRNPLQSPDQPGFNAARGGPRGPPPAASAYT
jgi:hypothetical protein